MRDNFSTRSTICPPVGNRTKYTYDADGRRIRKIVSNSGLTGTVPDGTTDCLYVGWRCIEERDGSNNATKQMVWGIYIDELIQQKNITALNNFAANAELYPLQDLLYRTTGLSDSSGTVREAYDCDAYGNTLIFRNTGSPPAAITFTDSDTQVAYPTCEFIFTGQRWDAESGTYYYKARFYVPELGRFGQRDPISIAKRRNLYLYCLANPLTWLDFLGLTESQSGQQYFDTWLEERPGTSNLGKTSARKTLMRGCVGVVCLELGLINGEYQQGPKGTRGLPDLGNCYRDYERALVRQSGIDCQDVDDIYWNTPSFTRRKLKTRRYKNKDGVYVNCSGKKANREL